jgi:hypothetical protein
MPTRDTLHRLIDELPESELGTAERFLHYLYATTDPVLQALIEAPLDDEPETDDERQAVQEARAELARGEVRTLEEVRRELDGRTDRQRPAGPPTIGSAGGRPHPRCPCSAR